MTEPKTLERTVTTGEGATLVRLRGVMGSDAKAEHLLGSNMRPPIVVDLEGVRRMTSYAVREWIRAIAPYSRGNIYLARVRPALVAQMNAVASFCGNAEVLSIYLPFMCDHCGTESDILIDLRSDRAILAASDVPPTTCAQCGKDAEFDDAPESYFSYVASQPEPVAPPAVLALLDHASPKKARLKVQKEVQDDVTALWLSGPLNERARFKRTVDGVEEGALVLICGGVTNVTEPGVEQLAQLASLPGVAVYFARCRSELARALDVRFAGERVLSIVVHGLCETCAGADVVVDAGVLEGRHPASCLSCGAPAHVLDVAATRTRKLARPPPNIEAYLATRPGAFLPGLEDGETSRTPSPTEYGTPMSRYRVLGRIGAGGMAEVLLAEQLGPAGFHKQVVLKRILREHAHRAEYIEMFLNEARVAAFIQHPNVAQIYDLGNDGPHYFIAMEYVKGIDLRGVIKITQRLNVKIPPAIAARIAADICAGLHGAHTTVDNEGRPLGIVHRDISPTNILLSNDGVVKIVDFGIAKTNQQKDQTKSGVLKGKAIYMPPEQIDSARGVIDARSDVFAAGLVLHQMLTGSAVFLRATETESLVAILRGKIPDPREVRPDVPATLAAIIARATASAQAERYRTAEEMRLALERLLSADMKSTTSSHVAHWLAWLRGINEQNPEPTSVVIDKDELSSAPTKAHGATVVAENAELDLREERGDATEKSD